MIFIVELGTVNGDECMYRSGVRGKGCPGMVANSAKRSGIVRTGHCWVSRWQDPEYAHVFSLFFGALLSPRVKAAVRFASVIAANSVASQTLSYMVACTYDLFFPPWQVFHNNSTPL